MKTRRFTQKLLRIVSYHQDKSQILDQEQNIGWKFVFSFEMHFDFLFSLLFIIFIPHEIDRPPLPIHTHLASIRRSRKDTSVKVLPIQWRHHTIDRDDVTTARWHLRCDVTVSTLGRGPFHILLINLFRDSCDSQSSWTDFCSRVLVVNHQIAQ